MAGALLLGGMDPDVYACYQSEVWDACLASARATAGPDADERRVRRLAARRFVRACLSYRAFLARETHAGRSPSAEAWLGRASA